MDADVMQTDAFAPRFLVAMLAAFGAVGCGSSPPKSTGIRYLTDSRYRRDAVVASLVNPANGYSTLRLAHYDSGTSDDWSLLPEWNPPTEPLTAASLDSGRAGDPLPSSASSLAIDESTRAGSIAALLTLGEAAFFRYPVQLAGAATAALRSTADAARYGLWLDAEHGVGGLVRVTLDDGTTTLALTCASCHVGVRGGNLVTGVPNQNLDWGALLIDGSPSTSAAVTANLLAWGAGRIDVTTEAGTEPVRLPDLRPVRFLTHLQADATVVQHDVTSLAIRTETLIITSQGQRVRPPREIALGLAEYVDSIADTLPPSGPLTPEQARGAATFQARCAACHVPPAYTGPPVPLAAVGTDPRLGESIDRGTGTYRVPSLHGVASRGPLLHDGRAPNLAALLDPSRLSPGYTGGLHGSGPIEGHAFGLDLSDNERAELRAYVETL